MTKKRNHRSLSKWLAALALAMLVASIVAAFNYRAGTGDLARSLTTAGARLSEKLAQHEAHLTALAAVVRMGEQPESVEGLAGAIASFYPRITEIATIRLEGTTAVLTRHGGQGPHAAETMTSTALPVLTTPGSTAARSRTGDGHYEIYKLVTPGLYLRMKIDAGGLVADGLIPAEDGYQLWLGEAQLINHPVRSETGLTASRSLDIDSASQPLRLQLSRTFRALELLPPMIVIPLLLLLAAAIYLYFGYRRALQSERHQERRAALLEQETKLAHAGRVNALGEMASGIAHELAQPVAALLSQSQAARRAMTLGKPEILEQALDANVREAKRAGDILGRMRTYIAGGVSQSETIPIERALAEALRLAESDLARRGIAVDTAIDAGDRLLRIDMVGFQQVLHNLLLNAAEALAGQEGPRISIGAGVSGNQAVLTISDNGPGIPAAARPRIFEPFFTTKPEGIGLGLPLCARLIEQMGGSMELADADGACFVIRLPLETGHDLSGG